MRLASLATLLVAVTVGVASAALRPIWTTATMLRSCAPATNPKVVFPFSLPSVRSGRGAILWVGGAPSCGHASVRGTTLAAASLHSNDRAATPRALWSGSVLVGPLQTAATTHGQLVATLGAGAGAVLGEGVAGTPFAKLAPLGGAPSLVATANGYIGDADVVSVATQSDGQQVIQLREQRHFERAFGAPVVFGVDSAPITALTVGMDFRADSIVMWAQGGRVYARWITNAGQVHPQRSLGPTGFAPQLAAVLSDNNHAFVMWTDEPPPGVRGTTTIYLEHSGEEVTFGSPRRLVSFVEPRAQRLTPGSLALARMAPSEGVLAAWTAMSGGRYVVSASGLTSRGVLPGNTIAGLDTDVRLAALASGPHDDVVVVLEAAPRTAAGFDETQQTILAAHSVHGGPGGIAFEPPAQLAPAGVNSAPSVAFDPASDRAVVAWQTVDGDVPAVAYAVRAAA